MSKLEWTDVQLQRLIDLGADAETHARRFDSAVARNQAFQQITADLVKQARGQLDDFLARRLRPRLCRLESELVRMLNALGFSQVVTPLLISKSFLARMSIDDAHPLTQQIFWVDATHCLRPMLAPNLYHLMYDLGRLGRRPVRFFEIGSCFRKESSGARHSNEFTMLNLVEMGLDEAGRHQRLRDLAACVMQTAGIADYRFETTDSEVYGHTLDVVTGDDDLEVASGAMGPHPLDSRWRISDTWVGLGFGLERLVMTNAGSRSLHRWARSISWLDGMRLNL